MALPIFCLAEVNYPLLTPQSELALFAALGVAWIFLTRRPSPPSEAAGGWRARLTRLTSRLDGPAAALFAAICVWIVIQTEPLFERWWITGRSLGARAGAETSLDIAVGVVGLALILIAARRALGWALPLLALVFLAYARWGALLPDALLPHRGYEWERIVGQTFLHSQGVFGVALKVMFTYVFPFLVFGALLEATGATGYVLEASRRLFRRTAGGPAKVAVLASGLMGSLSGSAVANTATTGTFTIPMMRAAGFRRPTAAGLEAAASSGGALVPPVMGAGAYMMLEIIDPPVTYLQILQAALLPAILYYLSLFLIVHFQAKKIAASNPSATPTPQPLSPEGEEDPAPADWHRAEDGVGPGQEGSLETPVGQGGEAAAVSAEGRLTPHPTDPAGRARPDRAGAAEGRAEPSPQSSSAPRSLGGNGRGLTGPASTPTLLRWEAAVFLTALATLLTLLLTHTTVFRAATWSMLTTLLVATLHPRTRPSFTTLKNALLSASRGGVALVTAAAAVGIVIGVVTLTGVGTRLPAVLLPLAQDNLTLALVAIMISSIILGLGLPSAVCYLLMATLIGPVLGQLGVPPLAAHLFIFYFGMMSMVTPPVALAAYAASSIAGSKLLPSSVAAFRFALIGFALPFLFVYRPELLMIDGGGEAAAAGAIAWATGLVAVGIVPLAAAAAGWLGRPLGLVSRGALFVAAALVLAPIEAAPAVVPGLGVTWLHLVGLAVTAGVWLVSRRAPAAAD